MIDPPSSGPSTGPFSESPQELYLDPEVLAHCGPRARLVDTQRLDLDEITGHLVEGSRSGKRVVRLTSGDPSLYSALHEQTTRLEDEGVAWQVTPGVPGLSY